MNEAKKEKGTNEGRKEVWKTEGKIRGETNKIKERAINGQTNKRKYQETKRQNWNSNKRRNIKLIKCYFMKS